MNSADMTRLGIALGVLYAAYRFAPQPAVKAMALGAAGVIVGKQVPFVREALA